MTQTTIDSVDSFDVVKKHVIKFSRPQDQLAWKSIGETLVFEIIAIVLTSNSQPYIQLMGWALHTLNLVRIFVQFHDMAHFSFF